MTTNEKTLTKANVALLKQIKMTAEKIHTMTSNEISAFVFAGASTTEPRSLRKRIGDDALCALPSHPAWNDFPRSLQDWVFMDIDAMLSE